MPSSDKNIRPAVELGKTFRGVNPTIDHVNKLIIFEREVSSCVLSVPNACLLLSARKGLRKGLEQVACSAKTVRTHSPIYRTSFSLAST